MLVVERDKERERERIKRHSYFQDKREVHHGKLTFIVCFIHYCLWERERERG